MDIFNIGGKEYAVLIVDLSENFTKLYSENTGRTMSEGARMELDCLGTFFGHKVTVQRKSGFETDFDELYNLISLPTNDGIPVKIVHNQSSIEYEAYISKGERSLKKVDEKTGKIYWDKLDINIIPMEAQLRI